MKKGSVLFLLCLMLLVGCTLKSSKETLSEPTNPIVKIEIRCMESCKEMYPNQVERKTYTNKETIQHFFKAIKNKEKIQGVLDYAILYEMKVTQKDNSSNTYYLNVGMEFEARGLIVDTADSHTGYRISKEDTQNLRTVLYKK